MVWYVLDIKIINNKKIKIKEYIINFNILELGIIWIFHIVVDSFNGISPILLLHAFTKHNIKPKL